MPGGGWQCTQISTRSCTRDEQGRVRDVGGDVFCYRDILARLSIAWPVISNLCFFPARPLPFDGCENLDEGDRNKDEMDEVA
jgi:hypothetical protein